MSKRLRREVQIQIAPCGCGHEFPLVFYSSAGESPADDRIAWSWVSKHTIEIGMAHAMGKTRCRPSRLDWRICVAYRDPETLEVIESTAVMIVDGKYVPKASP